MGVWSWLAIAYGLALTLVGPVVIVLLRLDQRGAELLDVLEEGQQHGPSTDHETLERLESLERRMSELHADAAKFYRKTAQERRRIEAANGTAPMDEDDEAAELAQQLALGMGGTIAPTTQAGADRARPRLRRRR